MGKKVDKLLVKGKRLDGRKPEDLRSIEMEVAIIDRADGSARVRFGDTEIMVAVHGPRILHPRRLQEMERGILRTRYNMAPFSVDERKRPGPDRRSRELTKVIREAFEPSIFLEEFPKVTIDAFLEVIQADGSTRVTSVNATSLALVDAGIPMRDMVTAVAIGKIDGKLVVDLDGPEDNNGEADVSFAMLPTKNEITLLQMDGLLTKEEISKLLKMAKENCKKIYELQKKTLKKKYKV